MFLYEERAIRGEVLVNRPKGKVLALVFIQGFLISMTSLICYGVVHVPPHVVQVSWV